MKKPGATTAKHSSPPAYEGVGVRALTCSLILFLGAALVAATPIVYGDDAKAPDITPEETLIETQQDHTKSMSASPTTNPGVSEQSRLQPTRLLDRAIEGPPVQTLDLGLCDGS